MSISVILDTNIFISGIFWDGNFCSEIIDAWRDGRIILITSPEIIQELVDILQNFKIEMPQDIIAVWRKLVVENAMLVFPTEKLDIVKNDPKDNKFFEAALAGKAQYIVSQDKKPILSIPEFGGIKTISPGEFVKILHAL